MRRPRLVLALLASCATLPAAAPSDATSLKGHRFLFMGGLQRSGTTWLEAAHEAVSYTHLTLPTIYSV